MRVPIGVKSIWMDCKDNTNYFTRIQGDTLIILTYLRKPIPDEDDTQDIREHSGDLVR